MAEKLFNPNFYSDRGDEMAKHRIKAIGCLNCGNLYADKTCNACKLAIYCNRNCQSEHWRKGSNLWATPHNQPCKEIQEYKTEKRGPLPILLNNLSLWQSNFDLETEMRIYGDLFILEMARISLRNIALQVFCSDDDNDIVMLVGVACFF